MSKCLNNISALFIEVQNGYRERRKKESNSLLNFNGPFPLVKNILKTIFVSQDKAGC
jgi:hypothetical protein